MNNINNIQLPGIIISVDKLNRNVWGSIYQCIEHFYSNGELKSFGLDIYWANTTNEDPKSANSKRIVKFKPISGIKLGNNTVNLSPQTPFGIKYNKYDGHDDFNHIASFLLLEKRYINKIVLGINLNNIGYNEATNYKFRLAAFCRFSNNPPIRILLKESIIDKETGEEILIDEQRVIQAEDVARTYLPFCKITKSTYEQLFVKPLNEIKNKNRRNEDGQNVIQYIQDSIIKLEEDFNKHYLKEFNKRYTTLFDKWFILAYFYSLGIPYTDKRLSNEKTSRTTIFDNDFVVALKNYTYNIQELSQNIIYHTEDQEGYLYVAYIKKDDLSINIYEKNNTFVNTDAKIRRFIEFGVMDCAKKGIAPTFLERNKNLNEKIELIDFFESNPIKTINLTSLDMRYAAHLGLKTFVASVKGQSGYFYVESNNKYGKSKVELCNGVIQEISSPAFVDGTHFHVIVPVSKIEGLIPDPKSQSSAESFIQQFKDLYYKGTRIKESSTDLNAILRLSNSTDIEDRNNEIKELGDKISKEEYSDNEIKREISIKIPDNDGSIYIVQNVYRLINYLQLSLNNNYFTTIVLTNLSEEFVNCFWNLFDTHVIKANLSPIWKNDCAIVLMSKNLNYRIISGEEKHDISALNNEFKKHYCISTNYLSPEPTPIKKELKYFVRPYELLIANNKYYYSYVDHMLRKCIEDVEQGYCVRHENTYIGSKMIVVNFYEAETLFQNSFFAERFAFMIAQKLKRKQIDIDEKFYIVGAGYHSDLTIKSLQSILSNKPKTMLAIDGDEIDFHYSIRPNNESKFLIVTPIGSTLSYHDKIAAFLMRKFDVKKENIFHHCVIVVGNKNENQYLNNKDGSFSFSKGREGHYTDIEHAFKWENIDTQRKQIILNYKNVEKVDYDILIGQKNEESNNNNWYHRINKFITYPENYTEERYVNRTENQSINSQNLLGLPKFNQTYLNPSKHKIELKHLKELSQYIYHGHIENHHTHYRYYIHSEDFIAKEKEKPDSYLNQWMSSLKNDLLSCDSDGYLNLIITPNARIESEFVNYINQEVFDNNAQIINIDAHSWKNNMSHKYKYIGEIVKNNDKVKFHYVDHALFTANTFLKTRGFLEEIIPSIEIDNSPIENDNPRRKDIFSSVIVLINRVSPNVTDNIAIKKGFHAFLNLFIPESTDSISDCVLCALSEFYKRFHDKTISSECNEIIGKNEGKIKKTTFEDVKKRKNSIGDKKQLRLLFTHELFYRIAEINVSHEFSSFSKFDLAKKMMDNFYSSEMNMFCKIWGGKEYNEIDQKISFVKVISSPPLTRFIAVREYAHKKLLILLNQQLKKDKKTCNLDDLKLLKAILKSLSFLNSTALVRKDVILDSWKMYNSIYEIENKCNAETENMNLFSQDNNERKNALRLFPRELYFDIKNAILEDETKSMFLNELLRTGEECLTMEMLKKNVEKEADFQVMLNKGTMFCDEVKQQYEYFLEWLYYDTTTVLQKALVNFEKETIKEEQLKQSFYINYNDDNPLKWSLADYQNAVIDSTIDDFKNKVVGNGNEVEYYYENLKLFNSKAEGIDYIDKLVRVLYAKLKLERLVDTESDNSQTKIEDDIRNILFVLLDIMDSNSAFIIFKHDEQSYYKFSVGDCEMCGKVNKEDSKSFKNDFSIVFPFENTYKTIQSEDYHCEYTQIDNDSVLYFAYKTSRKTVAPSKAQKQLLLLLKNKLCRYIRFIRNKGLLDIWVEEQRTNDYYKERYKKNAHNALGNLNRVSNNYFSDINNINKDYVDLYAIIADLHVGKIHNSLLVNDEEEYESCKCYYESIKPTIEHFIECARFYLNLEGIAKEPKNFHVGDFNGKTFYYTSETPFLLFQFIHNIPNNTLSGRQKEVVVSIYIDNDCIVIKNSHSKITENRIDELKRKLKYNFHNEALRDHISLFCINYYCKHITGKELEVDMEENRTFVVRIPIIVNN